MSVIKPILQHAEQVAYFSGANNYCWAHFRDGEKKLLAKPISFLESQLSSFVRVHKTVLLNPSYVQRLFPPATKKMAGRISLHGGDEVPVSRRRWQEVAERLAPAPAQPAQHPTDAPLLLTSARVATKDLILITDDLETARLIEQTVRQHGPEYQCHVTDEVRLLLPYLQNLRVQEQPILLLIDARTATTERLQVLSGLKASPALCHLPIVLLVTSETNVTSGYQRQANCVLAYPAHSQLPQVTLDRLCRFWLTMVTLPPRVQMVK